MSDLPTLVVADFETAIVDARAGGEAGLTALFRGYHPRLLRYLRSREPRRAEDLAGEVWVAVASSVAGFDGDQAAFGSWLFTIARNRLADARRTGARRRTDPVAEVPDRTAPSPEGLVIDALDAQGAADLVTRVLTADQSEVVLLRVLGGLSVAEVAAVMGREEGWVRVTHHRGIRRLQQQLDVGTV